MNYVTSDLKVGDIVTDDDGGAGTIKNMEIKNNVFNIPHLMADVYWHSERQYCWCYAWALRKLT